jgi:FkbM family methyltransferase
MFRFFVRAYRALFAHPALYPFNKLLFVASLSGLGVFNFENDRVSGERHFLKHGLPRRRGVVLDVGANVGDYSATLLGFNPHMVVHAFEPHPRTFAKLAARNDLPNTTIHNVAAGDADGTLELFDHASNDGSVQATLYRDVIEGLHASRAISHPVRVIRLDDFVREHRIDRIALLKIDTEGHELNVLRGLSQTLEAGLVDVIHFEFNEMNVSSRSYLRDFWQLLPDYDLYRLLPRGMLRLKRYSPMDCEIFSYQNIVAIRKALGVTE